MKIEDTSKEVRFWERNNGATTQNCLRFSMKIACWNVRGFHKPLKQGSVQTLVNKIDIFGLLESKFDGRALESMLQI